ncbi:Short-chain dehydrogenase involved in D-alanine esterification of teichoic acids [Friedmanniella luteola]|uniref:Short-chain dehydrogenase involved in D-alanine esterification of teichoic acids n=1 Tax=Friedmanniella luteola TaxID=546871 RepID=A0A1H1Y3Z9_9ACTN|nr:SDR family NAD(P)-dependent oxidoreductase [Friedmanniella luteola]SDT16144.1 Short-chain dehydrogenase involved in D-alanine esterification of teichoic acids [Friedmanniella luteola]
MRTTGNTLFIPGATSGIGLGLARRFADAGNTVVVGGRRRAQLDAVVAEDPRLAAVEIDVTDPASVASAAAEVTRRFPAVDGLVIMAGIMQTEDLTSPDFLATAERTVATNLLGPLRLLSHFVPVLSRQPTATVMTVSSGLAFVPLPGTPTYSATKAAVHSLTESLRVQLAGTGVAVVELVPPAVQTGLMDRLAEDPTAMPLEAFLDEVMAILADQPDVEQVLVERVKPLRFAEVDGHYPAVLARLSGR